MRQNHKTMSTSFSALQGEYQYLWSTMQLRQEVLSDLDRIVGIISSHKADYEKVSAATGVPWYAIAAIHNLEASLNFTKHLHNGNPLTARTFLVPPGRPKTGNPPFAWAESAADALLEKVNGTWKTVPGWSIPALLWKTEMYNGAGLIDFIYYLPYNLLITPITKLN
jgi:lysozyme family protein